MKANEAIPDNSDYFKMGEQLIRKGSAAAFMKNNDMITQILPGEVPASLLQDQLELAEHLTEIGFFDHFQLRSKEIAALLIKANPNLKVML